MTSSRILERAWRLATLGLPAGGHACTRSWRPCRPSGGRRRKLSLAVLYLLTFAVDLLPPAGDLGIKAAPSPGGEVRLAIWVSGKPRSAGGVPGVVRIPSAIRAGIQGSLGPALAAAIAAQHGGSLTVAPRKQGGVVFSLELPPPSAPQEPHEPII